MPARRPGRLLRAAFPVLAPLVLGGGCASVPLGPGVPGSQTTVRVENDSLGLQDGNYTSGIAVSFVSAPLPPPNPAETEGRLARLAEGVLALLGARAEDERRLGWTVAHLIYTPEDLTAKDPAPGAHPYSGSAVVDLTRLARGTGDLSAVTLRVGFVGPATETESIQKAFHRNFGATRPRGWKHQLPNEPLLNLSVERFHRVGRGNLGTLETDLVADAGVAAGTWFTGARIGATLRLGDRLPADLGRADLKAGFLANPVLGGPDTEDASFAFVDLAGYGVLRSLPVDGTLFTDSRDADTRAGVSTLTFGLALARRSARLSFAYTLMSDTYAAQDELGEYGAVALTLSPSGGHR